MVECYQFDCKKEIKGPSVCIDCFQTLFLRLTELESQNKHLNDMVGSLELERDKLLIREAKLMKEMGDMSIEMEAAYAGDHSLYYKEREAE